MITKKILDDLYKWASVTDFPLRNEVITSKYMGYEKTEKDTLIKKYQRQL